MHFKTRILTVARTAPNYLLSSGLIFSTAAHAETCPTPSPPPTVMTSQPDTITMSADRVEIRNNNQAELTGEVILINGDQTLTADQLHYQLQDTALNTGQLTATGTLQYTTPELQLSATQAQLDLNAKTGEFAQTNFILNNGRGNGRAATITLNQDSQAELNNARFTTCGTDNPAWAIASNNIQLNRSTGRGEASNLTLRVKGVPVGYIPWLSFPIDDQRHSGLLAPQFGQSSRNGIDISVPYYWNLAPQFDLITSPRLLSKRGLALENEFRYLTTNAQGTINANLLPDDHLRNNTRHLASLTHQQGAEHWRLDIDAADVSDRDYFDDLGNDLASTRRSHLHRHAAVHAAGEHTQLQWQLGAQLSDYRPLEANTIKARQPSVFANVAYPLINNWLTLKLDNNWSYFDIQDTDTQRLHNTLALTFGQTHPAYFWNINGHLNHTRYRLDNGDHLNRSLPQLTANAGVILEKTLNNNTQTLEPSIHLNYTPFKDQTALPLLDTATPDTHFAWLTTQNRYTGIDRIGDAQHIGFSLKTAFYAAQATQPWLSARLGQRLHAQQPRIRLADEIDEDHGPLLGELQFQLGQHWQLYSQASWYWAASTFERAQIRLNYARENQRISLGWRQRHSPTTTETVLDQLEFTIIQPITARWQLAGHWQYALDTRRSLETLAAIEYRSCCWAVQLGARRFRREPQEDLDTSVFLQIELTGLGQMGRTLDDFLAPTNTANWNY